MYIPEQEPGRAGVVLIILDNIVADFAVGVLTDCLVNLGVTYALALNAAGVHRAAAYEDRGQVHSRRRHNHSGYNLVAVWNEHNAVERVSGEHYLNAVRDKLS